MVNNMLERLTGHDRYRPLHPEFSGQELRHALLWSSARRRWVATCKEAACEGRVEELHAMREKYLRVLQGYALILKGFLLLELDAADRDRIQSGLAEVESLHAELVAQWVTLDDLYLLAVKYLSPTAQQLRQYAASHPPPQAWYDEDSDPFLPDD